MGYGSKMLARSPEMKVRLVAKTAKASLYKRIDYSTTIDCDASGNILQHPNSCIAMPMSLTTL